MLETNLKMNTKLRLPKIEDIESYHEVFSDEKTHHFIIDEGKQDLEGSTRKLNKLIEINGDKKKIYTITYNNIPAGFIVIHLDDTNIPFISYAVRRSYWRKGIAENALRKLIQIEKNNFSGFKAATHLENKASQGLLVKAGFTKEGIKDLEVGQRTVFSHELNSN